MFIVIVVALIVVGCQAQEGPAPSTNQTRAPDNQVNVNWLYGSYIPKNVPREPLSARNRFRLYVRQTYITPGIYAKTAMFAVSDQINNRNPEWGDGFGGFAKRFGDRQVQFILQNSFSSLGNGLVGWEPRYDRCSCDRFWERTRYAVIRNFVTYDHSEKSLRPQIMPYLGAFGASAIATTWQPGNPSWQIKGYQAAITQIFIGSGVNWLSEFAPDIGRILHLHKKKKGGP
jgi:hypothetical protein